jgi:hypothetical protein
MPTASKIAPSEQAAPKLDRGFGVTVSTYAPMMRSGDLTFDTHGMDPGWKARFLKASHEMMSANPDVFHSAFARGTVLGAARHLHGNARVDGKASALIRLPRQAHASRGRS